MTRVKASSNFLALDQSLNTSGWAIYKEGHLANSGTFTTDKKSDEGPKIGEIFIWLCSMHNEYEFDRVVFEDVQNQQNENTYKKLSRVQGAIIAWCEIQGVNYNIVAPSHWRSVLGGSWGRKRDEQKQHAIEYVKDVLDKDVSSDEADALCIGLSFIKEDNSAW